MPSLLSQRSMEVMEPIIESLHVPFKPVHTTFDAGHTHVEAIYADVEPVDAHT